MEFYTCFGVSGFGTYVVSYAMLQLGASTETVLSIRGERHCCGSRLGGLDQ